VGDKTVLSAGTYHAALLDYLAGNGEAGLACAYELGRQRIDEDCSLLQLLRVHQEAVNAILASTPAEDERLRQLKASGEFLMEALSTFELLSRGYLALLEPRYEASRRSGRGSSSHH
jgi:hypothetical protein